MVKLFWYELVRRRSTVLGWGFGLTLFSLVYLGLYPSLEEQMRTIDLSNIPIYQVLGNFRFGTLDEYLASIVLSYMGLVIGIYAILAGTGALAGEEDQGTLEILVTLPLSRAQLVIAKALAISLATILVMVLTAAGTSLAYLGIKDQVTTDLKVGNVFFSVFNLLPITLFFIMLGLWLGALLPSRRHAGGVTTVIFIVSYLGKNLSEMIDALKPLKPIFPFTYFDSSAGVLTQGVEVGDVLVLLCAAFFCFLLAWLSFQYRNLTTGAWFFMPNRPPKEKRT